MPTSNIPLSLESVLKSGDIRLCRLWRMQRPDATVIRITDWDVPVTYAGEEYTPAGGIEASAKDMEPGVQSTDQQAIGYLTDERFTEQDLRAGLYDGAVINEYVISAAHPWAGSLIHHRSEILNTENDGTSFRLNLVNMGHKIRQPVGRTYTKECSHQLGDAFGDDDKPGCKQNTSNMEVSGTVVSVTDATLSFTSDITDVNDKDGGVIGGTDGWFAFGEITFDTGNNAGLVADVEDYETTGGRFFLLSPTSFEIEVGDTFTAIAGCPKVFGVCKTKFGQILNYGGFPTLPGTDRLYLTPG